ncbi:MAG TPA: four helix bundle protein [Anaerolineales bacterium]|nr:four helix bundle protein [Anaerolineales bacterium]
MDGEQQETQHWIRTALDCGYISQAEEDDLLEKCAEIGRLLGGIIAKAEQVCNPSPYHLDEEPTIHFVPSSSNTEN